MRAISLTLLTASPAISQADALAKGRVAMGAYELEHARTHLADAVRLDPGSYEANWRYSTVLLDLGRQVRDQKRFPLRDSLYRESEKYARRATGMKPDGADGHFSLANALGRTSLSLGKKDRIKKAAEIRSEAERAIALDPKHDGAYHILGRWHAEIKRLSGIERFVAKNVLGGKVLDEANWDAAEKNLRLAVQYDPSVIYHRLDLAEVLADRKLWPEAKLQIDAIASMKARDPSDPIYKQRAQDLGVRVARDMKR